MSHQENSLYWVACNSCAKAIFSKDDVTKEPVKMFVSSCGCLFCSRCVQSCTASGCSACGTKSKIKVVPIGKNLPQSIMEMFNKSETSLTKMDKRIDFQNHHYGRTLMLLKKKRKFLIEKLHHVKGSESKRPKRKEALKKLESKVNHKKSNVSKLDQTKLRLESKRIQHSRMLNMTMNSNTTMFAGAIISPPVFNEDLNPPPTNVNAGFSGFFKKWF